ncbi:DUF2637 domain-containing protein [Streptomyces albireticuli]|nr:DUF2637 domain-containing protein [Streptomyces albireticuli]
MNADQVRSAERALSVGMWLIVFGAMLYSILTVTPLMASHTPDAWDWTAPILPLVVDAAVVIVVWLDSALARLGGSGGRWPTALRWMTGTMTLALNIGDSALLTDMVGVAVHAVAPLLLIVTAETGLAYRRAIAAAVNALEARQRAEREAVRKAAEDQVEAAARREREQREHDARLAREQREHDAQVDRERREHQAQLAREQGEREERARREARELAEAREARERDEAERREQERAQQQRERERRERESAERRAREERERTARERREHQERAQRAERERAALLATGPATERQSEERARKVVRAAFDAGLPVRTAAELTGWSTGWISTRYQELRDHPATEALV